MKLLIACLTVCVAVPAAQAAPARQLYVTVAGAEQDYSTFDETSAIAVEPSRAALRAKSDVYPSRADNLDDGAHRWGKNWDTDDRGDGFDGWRRAHVSAVPEAGSWLLMAAGSVLLALIRFKISRRSRL